MKAVNYRKLKEATLDDHSPISNVGANLAAKYFITLDLANGFHKIEKSHEDIQKYCILPYLYRSP